MTLLRQSSFLLVALGVLATTSVFMGRPATAQRAKQADKPTIKMPYPTPPAREVAEEPLFQVEISRKLDKELGEDEAVRYEAIAAQLSKFSEVPTDRLRFFSAYEATLNSTVIGWAGNIMGVDSTPDGLLVNVRVGPRFPRNFIYPITTKKYFERFLISRDGSVTYLDSSAPDGGVGEPPVGVGTL